ncbi:MAG TPA: hypothetical protein VM534_10810, partial [Thermoanaerobaculia bacterium]|nr:hypothetical protein [Thermoanaerobaculia bacterium]
GTRLLMDLDPGYRSSNPAMLTSFGNRLLFRGTREGTVLLWISDGTVAGTLPLRQVHLEGSLLQIGSRMLFGAMEGGRRYLMVTDGTAAGTVPLREIAVDGPLIELSGRAVFAADDGVIGSEPWVSDGTVQGTRVLRDLHPGSGSWPRSFTRVGDRIFFEAADPAATCLHQCPGELWKTDGTSEGTNLVRDINPGSAASSPDALHAVSDDLYFFANDGSRGFELWRSDGTASGTVMVADLFFADGGSSAPRHLTPAGDHILFFAEEPEHGLELWTSDGKGRGTRLVRDLVPGPASSQSPTSPVAFSGLWFFCTDPFGTPRLWSTDGTEEGTALVETLPAYSPLAARDRLFYVVKRNGREELRSLEADGARRTLHVAAGLGEGVVVGGRLYFPSSESGSLQLWVSDGSESGTRLVADLSSRSSGPLDSFRTAGGIMYFLASGALWASDGTEVGTMQLALSAADPTPVGEWLYFTQSHGVPGRALWRTRGAPSSTVAVTAIPAPDQSSGGYHYSMIALGNLLFFAAQDGAGGHGVWRSDGTSDGTILLTPKRPETRHGGVYGLSVVRDRLFFTFSNGSDPEIWTSDGTVEGTALLVPGVGGTEFILAGRLVFFNGTSRNAPDRELWALPIEYGRSRGARR